MQRAEAPAVGVCVEKMVNWPEKWVYFPVSQACYEIIKWWLLVIPALNVRKVT
jgi:hypothetical protein